MRYAADRGLPARFIELMPISASHVLSDQNFLPVEEVKQRLSQWGRVVPVDSEQLGYGPARYFKMEWFGAIVGFIGAITDHRFCERCNKIRLTADGKIRPCLGHHDEHDLRPALQGEGGAEAIQAVVREALTAKPREHLFRTTYRPGRVMVGIGG